MGVNWDELSVSHPGVNWDKLSATKPVPNDTSTNAADIGRLGLQGVTGVGGAIGYGLEKTGIAPEFGRTLQDSDLAVQEKLKSHLSPAMQDAAAQPLITDQGEFNSNFGLRSLAANVVPSIPGSIAMGMAGGPLATGATKVLQALGVGAKAAGVVGRGLGFGTSEGVFSGAQNAEQWGHEQRARPISDFARHPAWGQVLQDNNNDPVAAKEALINQGQSDIFKDTTLKTGGLSALTGGGMYGVLRGAKATAADAARYGFLKTTGKSVGTEALQEAPQSYYEQKTTNQATKDYVDPNQDVNQGAVNAGLVGGISGGVMGLGGGVAGLGFRHQTKVSPLTGEPVPEVTPDSGALTNALNNGAVTQTNTADIINNAGNLADQLYGNEADLNGEQATRGNNNVSGTESGGIGERNAAPTNIDERTSIGEPRAAPASDQAGAGSGDAGQNLQDNHLSTADAITRDFNETATTTPLADAIPSTSQETSNGRKENTSEKQDTNAPQERLLNQGALGNTGAFITTQQLNNDNAQATTNQTVSSQPEARGADTSTAVNTQSGTEQAPGQSVQEAGQASIVDKATGLPFTTKSSALKALSSKTAYPEATPATHEIKGSPDTGFVLAPKQIQQTNENNTAGRQQVQAPTTDNASTGEAEAGAQQNKTEAQSVDSQPAVTGLATTELSSAVSDMINNEVMKPVVSKSIRDDGQKVLDAHATGDIETLKALQNKYAMETKRGADAVHKAATLSIKHYDQQAIKQPASNSQQASGQQASKQHVSEQQKPSVTAQSIPDKYKSDMNKEAVSSLLPFNIFGNKSHLLANSIGKLMESAAKSSTRVIDAFGGSGGYTHYLAHTGALPKGSILNEFDPMRAIAHKQIKDNPNAVRDAAQGFEDYVLSKLDIPTSNIGNEHVDNLKRIRTELTQWARDQLHAHAIPGQDYVAKGKSNTPIEMQDNPSTAGLYYFLQSQSFNFIPIQSDTSSTGNFRVPGFAFITIDNKTGKVKKFGRGKIYLDNKKEIIKNASERTKNVDTRRGNGWELIRDEAGKGDLVTVDTSYLNKGKVKTSNYSKATEEDANPDVYLQKVTDNLLPAWERGAKLVITNNWNDDVANTLESLGFHVYQTQRSDALQTGDNNELVALNFDPGTNEIYSTGESLANEPSGQTAGEVNTTGNGNTGQNGQQSVAPGTNQEGGTVHRPDGGLDEPTLFSKKTEETTRFGSKVFNGKLIPWVKTWMWGGDGNAAGHFSFPSDALIRQASKYVPKKPVTLYRAHDKNVKDSSLQSWTHDKDIAEQLAEDYGRELISREFTPEQILIDISLLDRSVQQHILEHGWDEVIVATGDAAAYIQDVRNKSTHKQDASKLSKSSSQVNNPHSKDSLLTAIRDRLDKEFGKGWSDRLIATGKFKIIGRDEAVAIGGAKAADAQGFYDPKTDTSFLVADNISRDATGSELKGFLLHEISTHALQLGKTDPEFQNILKQFENLHKLGNAKVKEAFTKVPKDTNPNDVTHEACAYYVQHNPDLPLSRKIIAWFRNAIRNIGKALPPLERLRFYRWAAELNENDIVFMANAALRAAPDNLVFDQMGRNGGIMTSAFAHDQVKPDYKGEYFHGDADVNKVIQANKLVVIKNPTRARALKLADADMYLELRGVFDNATGNLYISSSSASLHDSIIDAAGLPKHGDYDKLNIPAKAIYGYPRNIFSDDVNGNSVKYSFAGQRSSTADTYQLDNAKQRLESGEDAEQVRKDTGWSRGADGKMRYEISDNDAALTNTAQDAIIESNPDAVYSLDEVLDHPKLFAAYPSLKNLHVKFGHPGEELGSYQNGVITLGKNNDKILSTLLHEIQHGIQNDEGFASGGSVNGLGYSDFSEHYKHRLDTLRDLAAEERKAGNEAKAKTLETQRAQLYYPAQYEAYLHLAGEVEARNTEARMNMSDEERKSTPPKETADTPDSEVAVVFNGKRMDNAPPPVNGGGSAFRNWFGSLFNQQHWDSMVYNLQDRYIDLKRQMQKVIKNGGTIQEFEDPRLGEELFHQRTASRIKSFYDDEFSPILQAMHKHGISLDQFQQFLHARHAPSRNKVMTERNPNQDIIDTKLEEAETALEYLRNDPTATAKELSEANKEVSKWSRAKPFQGSEEARLSLSGMSDKEAADYMSSLTPAQKLNMDVLGKRIDKINNETLDLMVKYGMETPESIKALKDQWQFYVPLHRDEAHPDNSNFGHPVGRGFSVRGSGLKNATGSNAEVTNIMAHIAAAREQMVKRGEKNLVQMRLAGFINNHPDASFAEVGKVPTLDYLVNGLVETLPDPVFKNRDNVVMMRVKGKDIGIVFNDKYPENVRLALSLKNMDGVNLDQVESIIAKGTRWLASVNTQYNVVFGIMNLLRDTQGAMLGLTSTPLAGKQGQVFNNLGKALKIISSVERGWDNADPALKAMYERFNKAGGTTGYSQMFGEIKERSKSIQDELDLLAAGKPRQSWEWIKKSLSDFNTIMENGTRLATFMAGVESGLSDDKAASIAKNITVNFNRKGSYTTKLGAFYAFFNASMQGTARLAETMTGPKGKQILIGGVALGAITTAIAMATMGDDDWEKIPEFVRERSLIIPAFGTESGYIAIPMPLGFHILPNIGRKFVESAFGSNRVSKQKRLLQLAGSAVGAFNPLGGSDLSSMVMPTVLDPALALWRNKDWTGRTIYQEDFNSLNPTPGFTRTKDTATTPAKIAAELVNKMTGGTDAKQGLWSPTPDQIDYVVGQLLGGTGREAMKAQQAVSSLFSGDDLPVHKLPLLGRIYGKTKGSASESQNYYDNLIKLNEHQAEIKWMRKHGKGNEIPSYMADNPEAKLTVLGDVVERNVKKLRERRDSLKERNASSNQIKLVNDQITAQMKRLNDRVAGTIQ